MERYQIQSAVRQLALTTSLMHGSPARRDQFICSSLLLHYMLDKSYVWLRYYLSNKCRGCRDRNCFQIKVPTVGPKGRFWKTEFVWIQRAFVCSWCNFQRTSMTLPVIRILYIFLWISGPLGLCTIWSFPSRENEKLLVKPNRWAKYYHPFNPMAHSCQTFCLVSFTSD